MDIQFASAKLNRIFNSEERLRKEYGKENSKKIRLRMTVLRSAKTVAEVPKKPPDRCLGLKGDRIGQYAVDLNHPFRLVFKPADIFMIKRNGSIVETTVTTVKIVKAEEYH